MGSRRFNPYKLFTGGIVPEWLLRRSEISPGGKLVYARLARYAGEHGAAFPKVRTLASEVGLSTRQTQRYIAELEKAALLETDRTRNIVGQPSRYFFLWHTWIDEALNVDSGGDTCVRGGGDTCVRGVVTHVSPLQESQLRESGEESHTYGDASGEPPASRAPQPKGQTLAPGLASKLTERPAPKTHEHLFADGVTQGALDEMSAKVAAEARKRREAVDRKARAKQQRIMNLSGEGKLTNPQKAKAISAVEAVWREEMQRAFPDLPIAVWGAKEGGQASKLITKYSGVAIVAAVKYVVRSWDAISDKFFQGRGDIPSMGLLLKLHERLVPIATQWVKHASVIEEWDAFFKAHPFGDPPSDLEDRHREAKKALAKLGLV